MNNMEDLYEIKDKVNKLIKGHKTWPDTVLALEAFNIVIDKDILLKDQQEEMDELCQEIPLKRV